MKQYGLILTRNYQPINFLRFKTDEESEKAYVKHKSEGYGVVKVKIEKAHELFVSSIPQP